MVKVAVAGATGHVGRCIVEAIFATKKHDLVVLSRSATNPALESLGVGIVPVSYTDPTSLDRALRGVHTVISAIFHPDPDTFVSSQVALLDAAVRVGVKRFAPSEFNVDRKHDDPIELYAPKDDVADAVRRSGLEYTLYETGIFMNYFAVGTPGQGHAGSLNLVVNVGEGTAKIPGDGNDKVAFTLVEDIGGFVAASLDLDKWPEVSRMAGDVKTYNEVVALAESAKGQKFDVTYTSVNELKAQLHPNPPTLFTNLFTQVFIEIARGRFAFSDLNLNKLLPEVKPTGLEEFLQKWWGGNAKE